VPPFRDIDAEIDPRLLRREPAHARADAPQVRLVAHLAERARHLAAAAEHHRAEAAGEREAVFSLKRDHPLVAVATHLVAAQVATAAEQAQVEEGCLVRRAAGIAAQ